MFSHRNKKHFYERCIDEYDDFPDRFIEIDYKEILSIINKEILEHKKSLENLENILSEIVLENIN